MVSFIDPTVLLLGWVFRSGRDPSCALQTISVPRINPRKDSSQKTNPEGLELASEAVGTNCNK